MSDDGSTLSGVTTEEILRTAKAWWAKIGVEQRLRVLDRFQAIGANATPTSDEAVMAQLGLVAMVAIDDDFLSFKFRPAP